MRRAYVPDAGDLVWLTVDPQAGREQRVAPAVLAEVRARIRPLLGL